MIRDTNDESLHNHIQFVILIRMRLICMHEMYIFILLNSFFAVKEGFKLMNGSLPVSQKIFDPRCS